MNFSLYILRLVIPFYKALQVMLDSIQFLSHKSYPGQTAAITPVYYDNKSKPLYPKDFD